MATKREEDSLREIERAADDVLQAYQLNTLPVNLEVIARAERIALLPGDYDDCFDGRIEYRSEKQGGTFYLFHAEARPGVRTEGRVRFSIAHELGHFFLPEHRRFLLSGDWHGSHAGFVSDRPTERQADQFASALLMPERSFTAEVKRRSGRVCTLRELASLADSVFNTSLTSTAIRYAHLCYEACAVVLSREHRVLYSIASEDMRRRGLGWIERRSLVSPNSPTARLLAAREVDREQGEVETAVWYDQRRGPPLWEEAVRLGRTGLILTLLAAPDDRND